MLIRTSNAWYKPHGNPLIVTINSKSEIFKIPFAVLYIWPNNEAEWKPLSLKQYHLLGHSQQESLRKKPSKLAVSNSHNTSSQNTRGESSKGASCLVGFCFVLFFFKPEPAQTFSLGKVEILLQQERMDVQ